MPLSTEKFILLDSTDSTNNYAMRLIRNGLVQDGTAVFALDQKSGKGRVGRVWHSEPGSNLIMSVISDMNAVLLKDQFNLSMIAAITISRLIEIHSKLKVFVKWPNDIFINDKKAGGILIENIIYGQNWQWAVSGFGININQKSFEDLARATSLFVETERSFDVLKLARELHQSFMENVHKWKTQRISFVEEYNNRLYKKDEIVTLESDGQVFEARIKGVTPEGKLITENDRVNQWMMNSVRIRLE